MADISKIDNGTEYNLKDATARAGIESSKALKSSVVTVNDAAPINAEDITVDITPQQDLHGYDRPWAGGAWKNKLPMTVAGIKAANTVGTWSGNTWTYNNNSFTILTDSGNNVIGIRVNGSFSANVNFRLTPTGDLGLNGLTLSGASGGVSVLAFDDTQSAGSSSVIPNNFHNYRIFLSSGTGAKDVTIYPMVSAEGGAFAPYSNICPIEGRTGAELDRVGKNWFDLSNLEDDLTLDYTTGLPIYDASRCGTASPIDVSKFDAVTLSYVNTGTTILYIYAKFKDGVLLRRYAGKLSGESIDVSDADQLYLSFYRYDGNVEKSELSSIQLELGTQPTAYEPYQHAQYTADFGETVHGGKWHVTKGGTDKTHGNIASYNGETINEPWLSSLDEYVAGATPTTGAQVVYPLTTPTTISTPKQNVPMLQGINTVSADCGDTSLKYQPDNVIGELKGEIEDIKDSAKVKGRYPIQSTASSGSYKFEIDVYRRGDIIGVDSFAFDRDQSCPSGYVSTVLPNVALNHYKPIEDAFFVFRHISGKGVVKITLRDDGQVGFSCYIMESMTGDVAQDGWLFEQNWIQLAADLFNN